MSLYSSYNNENIISRAVIAGMLNVLNNALQYEQVWDDSDIEEVKVPWFYNQAGDERFMQDFYTFYDCCNFPKPVDGNFDIVPRGMITYTSSNVDAERITNRFVKGRYVKQVGGQLESYVSFLYSIPLTFKFECVVWLDNYVSALKVEQVVRETFYKTVTFYVYYKGMRLGCTSGFSEDSAIERLVKYSFEQDKRIKLTFTTEVETYQPVFDQTTEMQANNKIRSFGYRIWSNPEKHDGYITITSPVVPEDGITVAKGQPLMIEWEYNREGAVINRIDAYWLNHDANDWNVIEKGVLNHQFYVWNIPETFTRYVHPTIIWEESEDVRLYRRPNLSIIPDTTTKVIDANSFFILDPGYFMSPTPDSSIGIILEMKDDQGQISFTGDNQIFLNLREYQIDMLDPVWVNPDVSIVFPGTVDYKIIDIHIANSVSPQDTPGFGIVKKIKIV